MLDVASRVRICLVLAATAAMGASVAFAPAAAAVEVTSQLGIAGGFRTNPPEPIRALFSMSLRVDVLFARDEARSFGIGPFLSLRSDNFADFAPALGLSVLLPVHEAFPFVLSAGGFLHVGPLGVSTGVLERLWWGVRSRNAHNVYTLAIGLFAECRQIFGPLGSQPGLPMSPANGVPLVDFIAGIDIDLEVFALPVILAIGAARTPPGYQYRPAPAATQGR